MTLTEQYLNDILVQAQCLNVGVDILLALISLVFGAVVATALILAVKK